MVTSDPDGLPIRPTRESLECCRSFWNRVAASDGLAFPDGLVGGLVVGEHAAGAAGGGRLVDLRQPLAVLRDDRGELGPAGQVRPLVRIVLHVVQFLAAVGVVDVAPTLAADAVVALVVAGDGRALALGGWRP